MPMVATTIDDIETKIPKESLSIRFEKNTTTIPSKIYNNVLLISEL